MSGRICVAAALVAAACGGQPEYFRPTERVEATSRTGEPESVYDVVIGGARVGEAKVWSAGAYRAEVDGRERTLVHVAIELENASDVPLTIDPRAVRLEGIRIDGRLLPAAPMLSTAGAASVPAGGSGTFEAYFELPRGVDPQDVDSFDVRWSVSARGETYAQLTPFREYAPRYVYAPYDYYYPYYPYGYAYDWYFVYPYYHRHVIVHHHVPYRVRHVVHAPPRHLPYHRIAPRRVMPAPRASHPIRHHGFVPRPVRRR